MKIVYILEQFHLHGGIEKITAQKVNWLINKGHDMSIIVTNQKRQPHIYPLNKNVHFINLNINYTLGISYFHPINFLKAPRHINRLKKTLKKINPDIVVMLSLQFDYYFLPFITKSKTIREFHSSRYFYDENREKASLLKKIKYLLNDYIEKKYDHLVVLTPDEVKHFKSKYISIMPNGIEIFNKGKSSLTNKTAIAAGRLAHVKNFEDLIEIWEVIIKKFPDWQLKIYGDGENDYVKNLQNEINIRNLSQNCCLCGATDQLDKKMKEASIFLMTSHTECYPMVLLEAKNMGLPIVSYDCPYGPRNIIYHNVDGVLVPNKNQISFIKQIETLILDKEKRRILGINGKKNIKDNSINIIMEKWLKLFNTL